MCHLLPGAEGTKQAELAQDMGICAKRTMAVAGSREASLCLWRLRSGGSQQSRKC